MKIKLELIDKTTCWFFHRWRKVSDNGFTAYFKCYKCCKARKVIQPNTGYQSINWKWLNFETDEI
jgi:hypothetical protein